MTFDKGNNVRQIIRDKRQWHAPLDAEAQKQGFKGWYSRGYLPYFDEPGVQQFLTWRLADALPASRRHEWAAFLELEDETEKRRKIEAYLDQGFGSCHLRDPRVAAMVQENLLHFDGQRYRLLAWVVMPNHLHLLLEVWEIPLWKLMDNAKSYTAHEANKILGLDGTFWQADYFDRYLRDEQHFLKVVRYIENNPVNARLVRTVEDWRWTSARHRSR